MIDYPALPAFVLALAALFFKTTLTSVLQVTGRWRARSFVQPEDAALFGWQARDAEAPFVQRCGNVWRNDVENLPLFLALALSYVLLGAPAEAAGQLFAVYVVLRYAHTVVYLRGLQPWRALLYLSGLTVCWIIAFRCVSLALA